MVEVSGVPSLMLPFQAEGVVHSFSFDQSKDMRKEQVLHTPTDNVQFMRLCELELNQPVAMAIMEVTHSVLNEIFVFGEVSTYLNTGNSTAKRFWVPPRS